MLKFHPRGMTATSLLLKEARWSTMRKFRSTTFKLRMKYCYIPDSKIVLPLLLISSDNANEAQLLHKLPTVKS